MKRDDGVPRILMLAYACNPVGSGEHWLGWGWAEQAAKNFEVDLVTTTNHQNEVLEGARARGINAHFVSLPEWLRRLTGFLGAGGAWLRKLAWQVRAVRLAESLHRQKPYALVHQTTFHTFRVPFLAARLGIPSVWGPIAGGERVPPGFSSYLGMAKFAEFGRAVMNRLWLQFPPIRSSLRRASVIFVSNRTTLNFLPPVVREKCCVVPPNALRPEDESFQPGPKPERASGQPFRLLYVGNCVATRAMPLVFEAIVQSGLTDCRLTIVGGGPALPAWRRNAETLGLQGKVEFTGKVPYEKLPAYYAAADALVFPALRDSGGSALLEAMSRNVPVVCLDWAGPGEMVDEKSGIKVPVDRPVVTIKALAEAFLRLQKDPGLGASLASAARQRAQTMFRWDEKSRLLRATYERLINR